MRIIVLDCPVDCVSMEAAVGRCLSFARDAARPRLVIPINVSVLTQMRWDERLRDAVHAGDLVLADGMPLVWASHLVGGKLPSRITGVDLMAELQVAADRERLRVYYLGARREVVGTLVENARRAYPNLIVAGCRDGYFRADEEDEVVREIRESRADILFVAMPTPYKEIWCHRNLAALSVPVVLPVGGAFDVHAGLVPRAPGWMQAAGLEWAWRLMLEPGRMWRRYLVTNTLFLVLAMRLLFPVMLRRVFRMARWPAPTGPKQMIPDERLTRSYGRQSDPPGVRG